MKISKFSFRFLVLASMFVGVFSSVFDLVIPSLLPQDLEDAMEKVGEKTEYSELELILLVGAIVVTLVVGVVSTIGLLIFRPWAPKIAVLTTALSYILPILGGPQAMSGVAVSLSAVSYNMWGAVVALALFSPIANEFQRLDS